MLAKQYDGMEAQAAGLTSVDRLGFYRRRKNQDGMKGTLIGFLREVKTPSQTQGAFVEMVKHARHS